MITDWRALVPADVMESLFWQASGPLISDDEPPAVLLAGMMVCAADGMLVNIPDTPDRPGRRRQVLHQAARRPAAGLAAAR